MKDKHKLLWGLAAGAVLTSLCFECLLHSLPRRAQPNLLQNADFEENLRHWGWYVHRSHGARAEFTTEQVRSESRALKISVTKPALYDSIEFGQGPITVTAGHKYRLSFLARATGRQPIRVQAIQNAPPWTFYGFRVSTEITPKWKTYHLTGRAGLSGSDAKLVFYCGGAAGDIYIDDVQFQDCGS